MKVEQLESDSNAWTLYLYAMKSPVTRDKYQKRLGKFFDFLGLEGYSTIEEKSRDFVEIANTDLPDIQCRYERLKREVSSLEFNK